MNCTALVGVDHQTQVEECRGIALSTGRTPGAADDIY